VYDKVAESNREMVLSLLRKLEFGERPGQPQQEPDEAVLPRRRPQDGVIDWNSSSEEIYNLVRALARPYPGAYAFLNDQPYRIWSAARTPITQPVAAAGTVIGPVHSPEPKACGQMVATANGAVLILEMQDASGNVLQGSKLSELDWTGRRLSNAA
jgi:methionyl-tRNA formyltransferase